MAHNLWLPWPSYAKEVINQANENLHKLGSGDRLPWIYQMHGCPFPNHPSTDEARFIKQIIWKKSVFCSCQGHILRL